MSEILALFLLWSTCANEFPNPLNLVIAVAENSLSIPFAFDSSISAFVLSKYGSSILISLNIDDNFVN